MRSTFRGFIHGFGFVADGIAMLRRFPSLIRWLVLPTLVTGVGTLFVLSGVFWGAWELSAFAREWFTGEWWSWLARGAFYSSLFLVAIALVVAAALALTAVTNSVFLGVLCIKAEKALGTPKTDLPGLGLAGDMADTAWNLWDIAKVAVVVVALAWVPVAGQIVGPVLAWYLNARVLGRQLMEMPWSARGIEREQRKQRARCFLGETLGVGTVVLLVGWVPFAGALAISLSTLGVVQWNLRPETRKMLS